MNWSTQQISRRRREFLSLAARWRAFTAVFGTSRLRGITAHMHPKKIAVVTFGGGARDDKTLSLGGQKIPHLLTELAPQSTFFAQIVTRGILRRYVATAHGRRQIAEVV